MSLVTGIWGTGRLPLLDEERMRRALAEETGRQAAMQTAWKAYRGDWDAPLEPADDGRDDSILLPKCATIVDTATSFLLAPPPTYNLPALPKAPAPPPDPDADPSANPPRPAPEVETPLELWVGECLRANAWPVFLLDARTNGGITGTAYAKVLPPDATHPYPQLQVLDSCRMAMRWNPRDITDITAYVWEDSTVDATGAGLAIRQITQRLPDGSWQVIDQEAPLSGLPVTDWRTVHTTAWPHPWPPIVHCKNLPNANAVYGAPDLPAPVIALNAALNFQYSNDSRVQHAQGRPIWYATGVSPQSAIRADRMNILPSEQGKIASVAPMLETTAARQLRKEVAEALDEASNTPAVTQGRSESGLPTSGVALRLLFWPMDQKLERLWACYEPFLTEIVRRLCALGDRGEAQIVTWTRQDVLPVDQVAQAQALQIEQGLGTTSKATLAAAFGRDWATEQANLADERAAEPKPPPVVVVAGQPGAPGLPPDAPPTKPTPPAAKVGTEAETP